MESTGQMQKPNPSDISEKQVRFPVEKKEVKPKTASIRSQIEARIKITGKFSGRDYLFEKAGSVQDVEEKDVEWMLGLRQGGRQCCGGSEAGNRIFSLA